MEIMEIRSFSWLLLVALQLLMPVTFGRSPMTLELSTALYVQNIVGRTFDFSHLEHYTKGVQLTFNGEPIDLSKFLIPETDVEKLENFLAGEELEDRLNVLTRLVGINKMIADKNGIESRTFALEDMEDMEDDVILDREDLDDMESRIHEDSEILDLNAPPKLLEENSVYDTIDQTDNTRVKRHILVAPSRKWTGEIPYIITSDFQKYPTLRRNILEGIKNWEDETCLKFKKIDSFSGPHLVFRRLKRCHSKRGRRSEGQIISIGKNCGTRGHVVHEIAHSLGLTHEQSRPDRSKYVNILQDNIKFPKLRDFIQESWKNAITSGVPYDYASVMHHDAFQFTKNENKTMTAKEEDMDSTIGSRFGLSFFDAANANYFYCKGKCEGGLTWSKCRHDGYRDPKNCSVCKCPDGWTGRYCTEVQDAVNETCGRKELTASSKWKLLTSPHYDDCGKFLKSQCTWRIKAPGKYKRVVVKFVRLFSLQKKCERETCTQNYIEVRYKDAARAGPRFCCKKPLKKFKSYGSSMLLLMKITEEGKQKGFKLGYKYESCGGCSSNTSRSGPPCLHTRKYRCDGYYTERCGYLWSQNCTRFRVNTCYKKVKYCCPGFKLSRDGVCYRRLTNGTRCERGETCDVGEGGTSSQEHKKMKEIETVDETEKVKENAAVKILGSPAHRILQINDENESSSEDMAVARTGRKSTGRRGYYESERDDRRLVIMSQRRKKSGDENESENEDTRVDRMDQRKKKKRVNTDSERDERRVVKIGGRKKKQKNRRVPPADERREKAKSTDSKRNNVRVVRTRQRIAKTEEDNEKKDGRILRTAGGRMHIRGDDDSEMEDGRVLRTGGGRMQIRGDDDSEMEDGRVLRTGGGRMQIRGDDDSEMEDGRVLRTGGGRVQIRGNDDSEMEDGRFLRTGGGRVQIIGDDDSEMEDGRGLRTGGGRVQIRGDDDNERKAGRGLRTGERRKIEEDREKEDGRGLRTGQRRLKTSGVSGSEREGRRVLRKGQRRTRTKEDSREKEDGRVLRTGQRRVKTNGDSEREERPVVKTEERTTRTEEGNIREREDKQVIRTGQRRVTIRGESGSEREDGRVMRTGERRTKTEEDSRERRNRRVLRTDRIRKKIRGDSDSERAEGRVVRIGQRNTRLGDTEVGTWEYENDGSDEDESGYRIYNGESGHEYDGHEYNVGHDEREHRRDNSVEEYEIENGEGGERHDDNVEEHGEGKEDRRDESEEEHRVGNDGRVRKGDDSIEEYGIGSGEGGDRHDENEEGHGGGNDKRERRGDERGESEEKYTVDNTERERDESGKEYRVINGGKRHHRDRSDENDESGESEIDHGVENDERGRKGDENEKEYKETNGERERRRDGSDESGEEYGKSRGEKEPRHYESDESGEKYEAGSDEREREFDYYNGRDDFESDRSDAFDDVNEDDSYEDEWEGESYGIDGGSYESDGERFYEYDEKDDDEFEGESYESEESKFGSEGYSDEDEEWEYESEEFGDGESEEQSDENERNGDKDSDEEWERDSDAMEDGGRDREGEGEGEDEDDEADGEDDAGNGGTDVVDYDNSYDY